ncbi:cyclophilin-like fold protein [Budvicia aquatica]|uniref:cyclophilin-like fold protein n=1 Tax=Budvicia aquatica TaxID=82979 RepID=UPI00207E488F|nr:cyclophilin-like fold protein [Budvicia aquatica]GKX49855.1 hypothetical protein SOASR029_01640 [Budvicia aquatica]
MMKKYLITFLLGFGLMYLSPVYAQPGGKGEYHPIQIRVINGNQSMISATLNNSQAAMDFLAMLPITLTLKDYGHNEKVAGLPQKLSTAGSPDGYTPSVKDIAYYAPWGNMAIYRQNFEYSRGLVQLGSIDYGMDILDISGPIQVIIEAVDEQPQ